MDAETIELYLQAAHNALHNAQYNFDGEYYGMAVNRAYYAFFYAATALLFSLKIARAKHSGVLAAFRQEFVKTGQFPVEDSQAYGYAFELRTITDYEMLGQADQEQAQEILIKAKVFVDRSETYLYQQGYRY